jgi:hypothetical protein
MAKEAQVLLAYVADFPRVHTIPFLVKLVGSWMKTQAKLERSRTGSTHETGDFEPWTTL